MEQKELNITLKSLLLWVAPPIAVISLFGILPTWLVGRWDAVWAELVAVAAVLLVMIATGFLTARSAARGASMASTVFLASSMLRMLLCPALTALLWYITKLPAKIMTVWMLITYATALGLECIWIVRALRQLSKQEVTQ
ncbi:MAG: hypothetical protein KAR11_06620 [Phycisphaerae bacterium]|nr:hypothetical protein [Phycisphaerae bacterium]